MFDVYIYRGLKDESEVPWSSLEKELGILNCCKSLGLVPVKYLFILFHFYFYSAILAWIGENGMSYRRSVCLYV